LYTRNERITLALLCLLLFLMIGILAFTAMNTVQAVHNLQEQYSDVKSGDVSTVHPWMTIHVVSHIYNVPEDYLYHSLQIAYPNQYRHTTLYDLASHKRQSVNQVISVIQHAILTYRKEHPKTLTPTTGQQRSKKPLSPTSGRVHY
jgi:hypothetical protein